MTTIRPLIESLTASLQTKPEHWARHGLYDILYRMDGTQIWADGSGMVSPRELGFTDDEQEVIADAIAAWEAGPLIGIGQC